MSLSRNSEGGIGEAAFLAAASFDAAKLEDRKIICLEKEAGATDCDERMNI